MHNFEPLEGAEEAWLIGFFLVGSNWIGRVSPLFLGFFVVYRFDRDIHRGESGIKKHCICFITVVQSFHILNLNTLGLWMLLGSRWMKALFLLLKLSLSSTGRLLLS